MKKKPHSHGGYELDHFYFIAYWRQVCLVLEVHDNGFVTVLWSDGSKTTHCTSLGKREKEVAASDFNVSKQRLQSVGG